MEGGPSIRNWVLIGMGISLIVGVVFEFWLLPAANRQSQSSRGTDTPVRAPLSEPPIVSPQPQPPSPIVAARAAMRRGKQLYNAGQYAEARAAFAAAEEGGLASAGTWIAACDKRLAIARGEIVERVPEPEPEPEQPPATFVEAPVVPVVPVRRDSGGEETVYATVNGECYHSSPDCRTLSRSLPFALSYEQAKEDGLRPCRVCY